MTGYRGTGGHFRRELGEPRGPRDETARFVGRCADTGAPIKPGDIIQRDRSTGRVVLVRSA